MADREIIKDEAEEIRRPEGRYEAAVGFVQKFPLNYLVSLGLVMALVNYMPHIRELSGVIPPTPFGSWLLCMLGAALVLEEFAFGALSALVKGLIVKWIRNAEDKAAEL